MDEKNAEAVRQANYNLYSVARHLLSNLAVVAVIDPLELSLNCKPLLSDVRCSFRTNAPISCTFTIGCRVSVDASGNIVDDGDDSYLEYSVLSIVAPGSQASPVIQARIAVVRYSLVRFFPWLASNLWCPVSRVTRTLQALVWQEY